LGPIKGARRSFGAAAPHAENWDEPATIVPLPILTPFWTTCWPVTDVTRTSTVSVPNPLRALSASAGGEGRGAPDVPRVREEVVVLAVRDHRPARAAVRGHLERVDGEDRVAHLHREVVRACTGPPVSASAAEPKERNAPAPSLFLNSRLPETTPVQGTKSQEMLKMPLVA
jgi:hypothetical protein